jgi:hypothetical protein
MALEFQGLIKICFVDFFLLYLTNKENRRVGFLLIYTGCL